MNRKTNAVIAAAVVAAGVALSATSASAYVVCNARGWCWHTRAAYAYRPEWGVVVHPDNWRWRAGERYEWREHRGRGYWRDGIWIRF